MINLLKNRYIRILIIAVLFNLPIIGYAKLVTCEGPDCTFAQFIQMIKNVLFFLVQIGIAFSAIVFAYAGWLYLSSAGDSSKVTQAHQMFSKMFIGLLFALGAYLIVELIINGLGGSIK